MRTSLRFLLAGLSVTVSSVLAVGAAPASPAQTVSRNGLTVTLEETRRAENGWPQAGRLTFQRPGVAPLSVETPGLVRGALGSFSPDGRQLTVLSSLGYTQLWDTRTGQRQFTLLASDPKSNWARQAVFAPDGSRLVMYAYPYELSLWDPRTGARVAYLRHDTNLSWASADVQIQFTPDGSRFVVAGGAAQATVFGTRDGRRVATLNAPTGTSGTETYPRGSLADALSGDATRVAVLHAGGEARLYETATGKLLGQAAWATGKFSGYDRHWMGTFTLRGRTLTGRSPNGSTFTATF